MAWSPGGPEGERVHAAIRLARCDIGGVRSAAAVVVSWHAEFSVAGFDGRDDIGRYPAVDVPAVVALHLSSSDLAGPIPNCGGSQRRLVRHPHLKGRSKAEDGEAVGGAKLAARPPTQPGTGSAPGKSILEFTLRISVMPFAVGVSSVQRHGRDMSSLRRSSGQNLTLGTACYRSAGVVRRTARSWR
jgi:hypothetical protein